MTRTKYLLAIFTRTLLLITYFHILVYAVSISGIEHNEPGSRERSYEALGQGAHQVVGKSPGPPEGREPLRRPNSALPAQPNIVVVHVRSSVGWIWVTLCVCDGARQDRPRIWTSATRSRLVLRDPTKVSESRNKTKKKTILQYKRWCAKKKNSSSTIFI